MSENPLLAPFTAPHEAPPFDIIQEEHYLPAVKQAIEEARQNIQTLKNNPDTPNFENTIIALETCSERLDIVTSVFYNLLSAAGTDALEKLAEEIGPLSANFSSDVALDPDIFARVKAVYDQKESLDLTIEQETLLDDCYKNFVRGGALLPDDKKTRLREINEELSKLGPAFNNNVKKSADAFTLHITNEKDLAGLPESVLGMAKHAAEEKGLEGWIFTLDYPSYIPFVTYADNRTLREQIWQAFSSRGFGGEYDNCETILNTVSLRDERAKLLGYDNHAAFVLERRMAETPDSVFVFLDKLKTVYKPAAQHDLETLKEFAKEADGSEDLKPWDISYYSEKLKKKLYDYSSEDLRPYFPLEQVLDGTFTHFEKLFGLRFTKNEAYPVWHEDVVAYDVTGSKNGNFMGVLYADFFPRTGKKTGAWATYYRNQGLHAGEIKRPVAAIVCNFTKPTKDKPSLLTFDEVLTLFHEMGHATHVLLSDVTYASHAGYSTLWDFVELPSQLQENWLYKKETLDLFARHYETGESIPKDLIDKVAAAKNFMGGWSNLRQVGFSLLDMMYHTTDSTEITDVCAFEDTHMKDTSFFPRYAGLFSAAFSHIFGGGYAAGFYSYKWAEVLDADTFELFMEEGLYDAKAAESFIIHILSKGGSEHPATLYKRFRGREADPQALFRREGLLDKQAA